MMGTDLDRMAEEIIAMHNELHHPGQSCPSEDADGACAAWTGRPAVILWTDSGLVYTDAYR